MSSVTTSSSTKLFSNDKILLDYVLSHAGTDERPYLKVEIFNRPVLGLLDSGATRSLVGLTGYQILQKLHLKLIRPEHRCSVANGQTCTSLGYIQTPVTLMGRTHLIDILVIPKLPHTLILGLDFWKTMGVIPNLKEDVWHFSDSSGSDSGGKIFIG